MQVFILFFLDSVSCETSNHITTSPGGVPALPEGAIWI